MSRYTYTELVERIQHITGVDPYELIERVRVLSMEYGKQKAKVEYLTETRKTRLFSIVEDIRQEMEKEGKKASEAKLESMARASEGYWNHQKTTYAEDLKLVSMEAEYFAARNQLDLLQKMIDYAKSERYHMEKN